MGLTSSYKCQNVAVIAMALNHPQMLMFNFFDTMFKNLKDDIDPYPLTSIVGFSKSSVSTTLLKMDIIGLYYRFIIISQMDCFKTVEVLQVSLYFLMAKRSHVFLIFLLYKIKKDQGNLRGSTKFFFFRNGRNGFISYFTELHLLPDWLWNYSCFCLFNTVCM